MAFQKGVVTNPAGRPKGAENKETKKLRDWIGQLLDDNMELVKADLIELSPKDRVAAISNLLEYALPKLARTEITSEDGSGFILKVITHTNAGNS